MINDSENLITMIVPRAALGFRGLGRNQWLKSDLFDQEGKYRAMHIMNLIFGDEVLNIKSIELNRTEVGISVQWLTKDFHHEFMKVANFIDGLSRCLR
jgi:hypothetical protein